MINISQNILKKQFPDANGLQDPLLGQLLSYQIYEDTPRGRECAKEKACIYCIQDVILLFKSKQRERECLKITKFELTYFMDGPISLITP